MPLRTVNLEKRSQSLNNRAGPTSLCVSLEGSRAMVSKDQLLGNIWVQYENILRGSRLPIASNIPAETGGDASRSCCRKDSSALWKNGLRFSVLRAVLFRDSPGMRRTMMANPDSHTGSAGYACVLRKSMRYIFKLRLLAPC